MTKIIKNIRYKEPKSLLEVRKWKQKASAEIRRLGWQGFHKLAEESSREFRAGVEKKRLAKLTKTSSYKRNKTSTTILAREKRSPYKAE